MISVVPSLPASSYDEIASLAKNLYGVAPELQIDIVDGKFVNAVSWPFTEKNPTSELNKLSKISEDFDIEIDCMINNPEDYLDLFVSLDFKRVIIHMHSTNEYENIITHSKVHGYKIGFAFTNDVPFEEVERFIEKIDFIQIMGIKEVGKQGQPFDERTIDTVKKIRDKYPSLEIAVDGSVNEKTLIPLLEAGVNRFAPGSAIAKQDNPKDAYHHLVSLLS